MVISASSYIRFAERALTGMGSIVSDLGDELANQRLPLVDANTPYAVLHHCLAVVQTWGSGLVAGELVERDRSSEFEARGAVADLVARIGPVLVGLERVVATADPAAPLRRQPPAEFHGPPGPLTQSDALQHVYEELAQHHGQLQVTRDVLLAQQRPDAVSA